MLGPERLERLGFGALLAVGRGSASPPRLVVLRWRGSLAAPPVAFVGKGIVFDTGGISIKPAHGMEAMRADMAGAAACAGAMLALALRRSPCPAVAVLAIAENATGADSYRPGDVLRTAIGPHGGGGGHRRRGPPGAGRCAAPRAGLPPARDGGPGDADRRDRQRARARIAPGLFGSDAALMAALAASGEAVGEHALADADRRRAPRRPRTPTSPT